MACHVFLTGPPGVGKTTLIQKVSEVGSCGGLGPRVCVIDEIREMELFSQPFIQAVRQTLSSPVTIVLGTIPAPMGELLSLVEEFRGRPDMKVFSVTKENRMHLLPDVMDWVQSCKK